MTREALVNGWIELQYAHQRSEVTRDLINVGREIGRMVHEDPLECLRIVVEIINKDDSDLIISNVAAGPLENLIVMCGDVVIDEIECISRVNDKFKRTLGMVWQGGTPDNIWIRVENSSK
ncbi:DUF6869 domain-containing protein [Frateuria defendens]|uniref:DUF6869 domain-containing protein n=1 Tax=Frateuria defendens TaxID=2219559 RepID=UPI0012939A63|nr:hypothetical protein [Frateuria defendens]